MFVPQRCAIQHKKCGRQKLWLEKQGLKLGDSHQWRKITKLKGPKECVGWIIRDGVIAPCGEVFKPKRSSDPYHTSQCGRNKNYWRSCGRSLGDVVRRKCGWRHCTTQPWDRVGRSASPTGEYWCCRYHYELEKVARKEDKWAEKLAKATAVILRTTTQGTEKRGRGRSVDEKKQLLYRQGAAIYDTEHKSWGEVAMKLTPEEFKKNSKAAADRMRQGAGQYLIKVSKQAKLQTA
jgi:hypothetical protein